MKSSKVCVKFINNSYIATLDTYILPSYMPVCIVTYPQQVDFSGHAVIEIPI